MPNQYDLVINLDDQAESIGFGVSGHPLYTKTMYAEALAGFTTDKARKKFEQGFRDGIKLWKDLNLLSEPMKKILSAEKKKNKKKK